MNKEFTNQLSFILYDPYQNNIGHYNTLKNNIQAVYEKNFNYFTKEVDLLQFNFDTNNIYIIYVYVLKDTISIDSIETIIKKYKGNTNIMFYINLWEIDLYPKLLNLYLNYSNIILLSDGNKNFSKDKINNNYLSNKPILSICPPIFNNNNNQIKRSSILPEKKYILTWSWHNYDKTIVTKNGNYNLNIIGDNKRWLSHKQIKYLGKLASKYDLILIVILNNINNVVVKELFNEKNVYYKVGKYDDNEYDSIIKNAELVITWCNNDYYNFRSCSRNVQLLKNKQKFVTNININEINNIQCKEEYYKVNKIREIDKFFKKSTFDFVDYNSRMINNTTWINSNFKKLIDLLTLSKQLNTDEIDILGNDSTLKTYDFHNTKIKLGMNAAYRYWEKHNVYPYIYIGLDDIVTAYHADNIHNLIIKHKVKIFILNENYFEKYPNDIKLDYVFNFSQLNEEHFLLNSSSHVTTGIFSIRLAICMGFKKINIFGMSGNYINVLPESEEIKFNDKQILKIVKPVDKNPNYFFDDYQLVGDVYNIPNNSNKYTCKCSYHCNKGSSTNGAIVNESLHTYVYDVLFYDLTRFNIKYKYENNVFTIL